MKNAIIAAMATYIFWTDCCVIRPIAALPIIFLVFWLLIAEIDEQIRDYKRAKRKGERLARVIRRMEREARF